MRRRERRIETKKLHKDSKDEESQDAKGIAKVLEERVGGECKEEGRRRERVVGARGTDGRRRFQVSISLLEMTSLDSLYVRVTCGFCLRSPGVPPNTG